MSQLQPTQNAVSPKPIQTGISLLPATNSSLLQTVAAKTTISSKLLQVLMEQLNKVNQISVDLHSGFLSKQKFVDSRHAFAKSLTWRPHI